MISPHTPPGTKLVVICVDKVQILKTMVLPQYHELVLQHWTKLRPNPFYLGQLVVLDQINENFLAVGGFTATIVGVEGNFGLGCFRVAELPKCLTDILAGVPVLEDV